MSLENLPKELLLMTLDYLPLRSIESLALTLNKSITLTCLPLLKPLFTHRRNTQNLTARFGAFGPKTGIACRIVSCEELSKPTAREALGISKDAKFRHPDWETISEFVEAVNCDEPLSWLGPVDERTATEMQPHLWSYKLMDEEVNYLKELCKHKGLTLPPGFLKFVTNKELMDRVPSTTANFFEISPLRKMPAALDCGAGGYLMRIYSDQLGCEYWDLYLDPGEDGAHCVLYNEMDSGFAEEDINEDMYNCVTEEEIKKAKEEGIIMAPVTHSDISPAGPSFEEWLALTYFEQWLCFVLEFDSNATEALKEYVRNVRVER